MRKRPLALFLSACLFLYFPMELLWRWAQAGDVPEPLDVILNLILPFILLSFLVRVTKTGWFTLVALVSLWGVRDLYDYYHSHGVGLAPLLVHLSIYCISLGYFINPRIRHLYFDPKMRWWRIKPRYETHMAFMIKHRSAWQYPILRNISEGGCFVETPHPVEVSEFIDIAIPLPVPLGVSVIKAEGEVRWVSSNPQRPGMGIQFRSPEARHQKAINEYVRRQL